MNTQRRNLIKLLLISSSGLIGCNAHVNSNLKKNNLDHPQKLLEAYQRLSGSFDDRLIIWWMSGIRYGVIGARSKPLFGMQVGMFHRFYQQPDGSFKIAFFELTYYQDLSTGKLLREYKNPYTGKTNSVRHVRLGPEIRELNTSGLMVEKNDFIPEYRSSMGPPVINGDRLWIPTSVEAKIKFPKPSAPEIFLNIYTTVQGSLSEAQNPNNISADCTFEFHNILKWEPWMQMGDHPGHMMSTASGRKLEAINDLPDIYREMANQVHPKYIRDPIATLNKLSKKLSN
ncbi:MAG: DUF1838 family protein [Pseudomonadota bacterium]|nr:DUF1838 family protein [Pseudomonadota bacterium]